MTGMLVRDEPVLMLDLGFRRGQGLGKGELL